MYASMLRVILCDLKPFVVLLVQNSNSIGRVLDLGSKDSPPTESLYFILEQDTLFGQLRKKGNSPNND